jgi:hypothetical protein
MDGADRPDEQGIEVAPGAVVPVSAVGRIAAARGCDGPRACRREDGCACEQATRAAAMSCCGDPSRYAWRADEVERAADVVVAALLALRTA